MNCMDKISNLEVHGAGKSDHMGILVNKLSTEIRTCVKTTRKRVYKNFENDNFIEDIKTAKAMGKFDLIHTTEDIEVARDVFSKAFCEVLDQHAPLKVIQNINGYLPYISKELKGKMSKRNKLKEEAAKSGDVSVYKKDQDLRNEVYKNMKTAESDYYKEKYNDPTVPQKMSGK